MIPSATAKSRPFESLRARALGIAFMPTSSRACIARRKGLDLSVTLRKPSIIPGASTSSIKASAATASPAFAFEYCGCDLTGAMSAKM